MSGFRTKLDYSNNRQIKQFEKTNTILSGGTKFGLPFSALTTGPNLDYSAVTNSYLYGLSSFSGNDTTTIFNWFDSNMQIAEYAVTAITPTTSADTQEIENIFVGNNQNTLDGNTFYVDYSGISFDIHVNYMIDLGGGNYSGTVEHSYIDFLSASSLDYQSRTIWIDNPEITRTDRLIITREPQIGYVWTCIDSEGMGAWAAVSGGTGSTGTTSTIWTAGTGNNSAVLGGSGGVASGDYSVSEGYQTTASGNYSHAEGIYTISQGEKAHAEGANTTASGYGAHAEGGATIASGESSHAEGNSTMAIGNDSHAEGNGTTSFGSQSHAEGEGTTASGVSSHAEGRYTTANGTSSHTEGNYTTASGNYAHAEGFGSVAGIEIIGSEITYINDYSHAEGKYTTASGTASHSEGNYTISLGEYSHAEGNITFSQGDYSHAEGHNTTASGSTSHAEGYYSIAIGNYSHAEGYNTVATSDYSHAEGYFTNSNGSYSHAEGNQTLASGSTSHAEGAQTTAGGDYSHTEGVFTTAIGEQSHAEGYWTTAIGNASSAIGAHTTASGYASHAEGYNTVASNYQSHAEGNSTTASGYYSHAEGYHTTASGYSSHAEGGNTIANGYYSHGEGYDTNSFGYSSHAEGGQTTAGWLGFEIDTVVNGVITLTAMYGDVTTEFTGGEVTLERITYIDYYPYSSVSFSSGTNTEIFLNDTTINDGMYVADTTNMFSTYAGISLMISRGDMSHSEGAGTRALAAYSHVEGVSNWGFGIASHVEGQLTMAFGKGSHAEGRQTTTYGDYSHIGGRLSSLTGHTSFLHSSGSTLNSAGSVILGGHTNSITLNSNLSAIIGGYSNIISGHTSSFIGGGYNNIIDESNLPTSNVNEVIMGGQNNLINGSQNAGIYSSSGSDLLFAPYSTIVGGSNNHIGLTTATFSGDAFESASAILGGSNNSIYSNTIVGVSNKSNIIVGGNNNAINSETVFQSSILNGLYNTIEVSSLSTIIGGNTNSIASGSTASSIVGGGVNTIYNPDFSVLLGGQYNTLSGVNTNNVSIIGGTGNTIGTVSSYSVIVGGINNGILNAERSVVIGGNNITATTSDTVYVPDLVIDGLTSTDPIATNSSGKIVAGTSDARLKQNINQLNNSLDIIKNLRGVSFEYTPESEMGDGIRYGFIAQEVQRFIPEIVRNRAKGDGMLSLNYNEIVPLLVEAVKELSTGTTNNTYLRTQTILAEDNNIDLNYNGTQETSISGGLRVLNAKGENLNAELITDENGDFITNNDFKPNSLTIPFYKPTSSEDKNGKEGNITRDDEYLYIKTSNGWGRTKLESF